MPRTRVRTATALLAALAVSALAASSAGAAMTQTATTTTRAAESGQTAHLATTGGVRPAPGQPSSVVQVQVSPTGDGPGDEQVCGLFEININMQFDRLSEAIDDGASDADLDGLLEGIDNMENMAMDAGCIVIY